MLAKRAWVVLVAAVCAAYFYGLGAAPLVGPDEPRYAQVAREMYLRGDLVTPTLAGFRWFEKPALLYWMMMACYGALGFTEAAARLGPALSGLLTAVAVGRLARRVERESEDVRARGLGVAAAAVTLSSGGMLVFSRGASFDVLLTATVAASLSCFLASELEGDGGRRRLLLAGFYAGVGLSLLSKGLVGVVLPGGVVAAYCLVRGRRPRVLHDRVLWGSLLALAVAAVWYAPAVYRHGWEFVDKFILQHHFARYVSNKYQHPQPFYFYLAVMPLLLLPWTLFLGGALWELRRGGLRVDGPEAKLRAFALAWLAVPVIFFSFSGSKLPGYVLPALPGAALLAASRLTRYLNGGEGVGLMRWTGLSALLIAAGGAAYLHAGGAASWAAALAVVAPACAAGAVAVSFAARRRVLCAASLVGGSLLTVVLVAALALGPLAERESVRELLARADALGLGQVPIFELHDVERTAEFYGAGRLVYGPDGQPHKFEGPLEVRDAARERGGRALVLVRHEYAHQLEEIDGAETRPVGDNGAFVLYYVESPERQGGQ